MTTQHTFTWDVAKIVISIELFILIIFGYVNFEEAQAYNEKLSLLEGQLEETRTTQEFIESPEIDLSKYQPYTINITIINTHGEELPVGEKIYSEESPDTQENLLRE